MVEAMGLAALGKSEIQALIVLGLFWAAFQAWPVLAWWGPMCSSHLHFYSLIKCLPADCPEMIDY
jgi:hypothetical protein